MPLDLTAAELAQRQKEMTHDFSASSADLQERQQAVRASPRQLAQGAFAGIVGAPVDLANLMLKAVGLGSEQPVLGSEWIGKKLGAKTGSTAFQIGTALPVGPEGLAKGAALGLAGMAKSAGKLEDALRAMPAADLTASRALALKNLKALPETDGEIAGIFKPADDLAMAEALAASSNRADDFRPASISALDPSLISHQETVDKATIERLISGEHESRGGPIRIVQIGGQKLILDGNHRLAAEKLRANPEVQVELLNLDEAATKFDRASAQKVQQATPSYNSNDMNEQLRKEFGDLLGDEPGARYMPPPNKYMLNPDYNTGNDNPGMTTTFDKWIRKPGQ